MFAKGCLNMKNEPFMSSSDELLLLRRWKTLHHQIIAGFTTKLGGQSEQPFDSLNLGLHVHDDALRVRLNRQKVADLLSFPLSQWVCAEQIHGNHIEKVTNEHKGKGVFSYSDGVQGADGLYTTEKNILLVLCYADCVPIYFFAPKHQIIGAAHAGWRGTVRNICGKMIEIWRTKENINPEDIYVAIGPSIGSCCYIVDDKVIDQLREVLLQKEEAPFKNVSKGQYALDLKQANKQLLLQSGIPEHNIEISSYCTSCDDELFFSHRRDKGKTGRMISFIGLKED
jgi:polyphenol oxidase